MTIDLPPSLTPRQPMQLNEPFENNRLMLARLVGQTIQATVIRSEALRADMLSNVMSPSLSDKLSAGSPTQAQAGQAPFASTQTQSASPQTLNPQLIQQQISQQQFAVLLRIGSSRISVKSDMPLTAGSQLQLKVIDNGQLQILLPALASNNKPATDSSQTVLNTVLSTALREVLPRQQPVAALLNSLLTLPKASLSALPDNVKQAIDQLLATLPRQNSISSAASLQQAIANSGLFREAKLAQWTQNPTASPLPSPQSSTSANTTTPNQDFNTARQSVLKQIQQLLSAATARSSSSALANASQGKSNVAEQFKIENNSFQNNPFQNNDLKTNTARLATALLQSLFPAQSIENPWQLLQSLKGSTEQDIGQQLKRLAQLIRANNSAGNTTTPASKEQQLQTLQRVLLQHSLATLARVQVNQLNSLPISQAQTPDNPALHQWILELPLLNGENIDSFALEITEEETTSEQEEKKERLWKVMLSFDLDNLGPLHVQLTLVHGKVSVTLWAEQPNTLQRVQEEIDVLRDVLRDALLVTGARVEQLECKQGCPPNRRTRLEQQLIDVHL